CSRLASDCSRALARSRCCAVGSLPRLHSLRGLSRVRKLFWTAQLGALGVFHRPARFPWTSGALGAAPRRSSLALTAQQVGRQRLLLACCSQSSPSAARVARAEACSNC